MIKRGDEGMVLRNVDVRHPRLEEGQLKVAHLLPVDDLGIEVKAKLLDHGLDVAYRNVGIPAAIDMKHQRLEVELGDGKVQEIGTVNAPAHADDAVEGAVAARLPDLVGDLPELRLALLVGMPVGLHIVVEIPAVIAHPLRIEGDLAVRRIHHAGGAYLIGSHIQPFDHQTAAMRPAGHRLCTLPGKSFPPRGKRTQSPLLRPAAYIASFCPKASHCAFCDTLRAVLYGVEFMNDFSYFQRLTRHWPQGRKGLG